MELKNLLVSAINNYNNGGLRNEEFVRDAHVIYNAYADYWCSLPTAEYPYLLGIVFAGFAKYYKGNIDYYTSIMENALFCFSKCIKNSASIGERQCAAIRLLLLIDSNDWVMKGIVHKFYEKRSMELYGAPLFVQQITASKLEPWTFESDILRIIGYYCLQAADSKTVHSSITSSEMEVFNHIKSKGKYDGRYPLVNISPEQLFNLFFEFITEYVKTPYDRRVTQLCYNRC